MRTSTEVSSKSAVTIAHGRAAGFLATVMSEIESGQPRIKFVASVKINALNAQNIINGLTIAESFAAQKDKRNG
jgi:hypothetical protein